MSSAISGGVGKKRVDKTASMHLKQAALPLVFHTEGSQENDILRQSKVDATMFDHLIARDQTRFRKMRNHQLMRSSPAMRGFSGEVKKYRKTLVSGEGEYLVGALVGSQKRRGVMTEL